MPPPLLTNPPPPPAAAAARPVRALLELGRYGDVTVSPRATREVAVIMAAEVVGATIYAYVVGALVGLIVGANPGAKRRAEALQELNAFLGGLPGAPFKLRKSLRVHHLFREVRAGRG